MKALKRSGLLLLTFSLMAQAGVVDTFGLGTRNSSLGNASVATDGGTYGAQGNPASLAVTKKTSLSLGYVNSNLNLNDSNLYHASGDESGIVSDPYSPSDAGSIAGFTFGATLSLSDYLALGLAGSIPSDSLAKIQAVSGNESTYLLFNDRQQVPEIYTSLGLKLTSNFSIGAGLYYSAYATGGVQMSTSEVDTDARMMMDVVPTLSPYFGALWNGQLGRSYQLMVGATYRDEQDARSRVDIDVNMETPFGSLPIESTSQLVAFYQPAELSAGAALKSRKFNAFASVSRTFWSKYEAPEISLTGDIEDLSEQAAMGSSVKLQDSMGYRVGMELPGLVRGKNYAVTGRVGFEYHTSALSEQLESVSILDNDRFVLGAGVGFEVRKIGTLITKPFNFEIGMKWISIQKDSLAVRDDSGVITDQADVGGDVFSVVTGVSFEI